MRCSSKMMGKYVLLGLICIGVASCGEPGYVNYSDRSDKVSLHGGDAPALNRVVQTEHPWPRYVNRTHIHMDGEVADLAVDRYKSGNVKETAVETTN